MPQAVVVAGHAEVFRTVDVERLERAEIGGRLDQDAIAGVDQQLADEVERLLGTGGDHDVLGLRLDAVAGSVPRDHLAQRLVTFGGAILQGLVGILVEHCGAGLAETLHGKNIGSWQASGEGDDLRVLSNLEKFANGRAADVSGALRVTGSPGG